MHDYFTKPIIKLCEMLTNMMRYRKREEITAFCLVINYLKVLQKFPEINPDQLEKILENSLKRNMTNDKYIIQVPISFYVDDQKSNETSFPQYIIKDK